MEIYPVIVHQPADERVEWKPQPVEEMRKEYYPLVGLRREDDLSLSLQAVGDSLRQISGRSELSNVLLLDGGDYPLALTTGSGHGCLSGKEMRTWALELEIGKAETEREHEKRKRESLSPYKGSKY